MHARSEVGERQVGDDLKIRLNGRIDTLVPDVLPLRVIVVDLVVVGRQNRVGL